MAVRWPEDLSCGVDEVDIQHRNLIALLNQLIDLDPSVCGPAYIDCLLNEFAAKTKAHFQFEENYLRGNNPSQLESHQQLHEILLDQMEEFFSTLRTENFDCLPVRLERGLVPWLLEHVINVDSKMAKETV